MVMDAGQIVREYRAAKHKGKSVEVLAQLNDCREDEILEILREGGVSYKELPRGKGKAEARAAVRGSDQAEPSENVRICEEPKAETVDEITAAICREIRKLEEMRRCLIKQMVEIDNAAKAIRDFVEGTREVENEKA